MPPPLPRRDRWVLVSLDLPSRWQPSAYIRRVGSRVIRFEAYSAFTHVAACVLAESLIRSFSRSASTNVVTSVRRPKCYRLERPLPGGTFTR